MLPDVTVCKWLKLLFKVPWALAKAFQTACSKRVTVHVGQHNLRPIPIIYIHAQQSGCGCGSALPEGPRHLLRSVVGYGNVAVNRQQNSYNYLEGGKDWSVSGIVYLLHSSASPIAHRNQPMSSEILINVCTTSALVNTKRYS